ncbi:MAG: M23 family metallopeptidase [Bacteroidota bacterium]
MNSDRIANRITDLIKLAGISQQEVIDELKDHYLTRIEEEVRLGVNSQKAIRETYQEIANLDGSQFVDAKLKKHKRGLFFLLLMFVSMAFYLFGPSHKIKENQKVEKEISEVVSIDPPMGSPIEQSLFNVSSEFGLRMHPKSKKKSLHRGIDILAKIGTPVLSTGDGKVTKAGFTPKAGKFVMIQHDGNYITKYFHLSDISVVVNQSVSEGEIIGKVGNSGVSMGPHLHYEVLKDEIPLNPREIINP